MSILPQVPEKMQTILQNVSPMKWLRGKRGMRPKRNRKLTGSALSPNARLRVVRTSRGKLSATHRNRLPRLVYNVSRQAHGATPDPRNG